MPQDGTWFEPVYARGLTNKQYDPEVDGGGLLQFTSVENGLKAGFEFLTRIYRGKSEAYQPDMSIKAFRDKYATSGWDGSNFQEILKQLMPSVNSSTTVQEIPMSILAEAILRAEDSDVYSILKDNSITQI